MKIKIYLNVTTLWTILIFISRFIHHIQFQEFHQIHYHLAKSNRFRKMMTLRTWHDMMAIINDLWMMMMMTMNFWQFSNWSKAWQYANVYSKQHNQFKFNLFFHLIWLSELVHSPFFIFGLIHSLNLDAYEFTLYFFSLFFFLFQFFAVSFHWISHSDYQ